MGQLFTEESKLSGWVSIVAAVIVVCDSLMRYRRDHELEMPSYLSAFGALLLVQGIYRFVPKRKTTKATFYCLEFLCIAAFITAQSISTHESVTFVHRRYGLLAP